MTQKTLTSHEAYAQEVTRIRAAMNDLEALTAGFEEAVRKGDRAKVDWGNVGDITELRIQLEAQTERLLHRGEHAPTARLARHG